jgi:catechol 2,3-dioxygenase-like lactoylglutathione lyase family enzyme
MAANQDTAAVGWIREVVLNSPDPEALARFWAGLLGGTPVQWYPGWVTLEPPPHGQRLSFQSSDGSADDAAGGIHFDVLVRDLEGAHRRVVAGGGRFLEERRSPRPAPDGTPVPWRVFADPDGHRFCLVVR